MKVGHMNILLLSIFLVVTLAVSANGSVWNGYYCQALPVSCEAPKVILQSGTAGTSTIYTSNTSAKVSVEAPVWLSGWDKRVKITIDNNDVDSALSDFPVLVCLSNSSGRHNDDVTFVFDEVGSNSKKIAVTTSDGTTECYVEIEKWDVINEKAWLWVKVPSISNTTETDLYLYYDADHADNTGYVGEPDSIPAEAVWDSYFKTVLHLHETSGIHYDSTSNNNNGTPQGGVAQDYATGEIDGADDFSGADGYIDFSTSFTAGQSEVTLELWVYLDEWVAGNTIYDAYYSGILWQFSLLEGTWYTRDASTGSSGSRNNDLTWSNPGTAAWHHLALRYTVSDGVKAIYVDGSLEASTSTSIDTLTTDRDDERLGYPCDGTYFDGKIDELRISTGIARSAAWIKASYESERDDLLNFGPEDYVDETCDLYPPSAKGTHANFSAQQAGPDSIYDTLAEGNTGVASNTTLIDAESFEGTWPPSGWTETGNWYKESNQAYDGTYSADFDGGGMGASGDLTTPDLDCSDADAIYVDFWYWDRNLESSEFLLRYYDGSSWDTISDLGSTTQEHQWLHYQEKITDSQYFKSNFKVRWSAVDVEDSETAFVDYVTIKKEVQTYNYELDLEVQWTSADYDETNEELCIKTGTFSGSEDIQVKVWNSAGSSWDWVMNLTASQWNNVSVTSYLTTSTFTVQFLGGTESSDVTPDSWNIDVTLLHVWTDQSTYDYVLKIVNQAAVAWKVNLTVYNNSGISRLSNATINLHDGTTSDQIIVSGGVITQSEGPVCDLLGAAIIYISIGDLQATTSGTSYLYVYLKILVPGTSTYNLFVITLEIT